MKDPQAMELTGKMSTNLRLKKRRGLPWPLLVFVTLVVSSDLLLSVAGPIPGRSLPTMFIFGSSFAQVGLLAMLCGLLGRSWITGWLVTTAGMVACLGTTFGLMLLNSSISPEPWPILFLIPLMTLGLVAPLAAARSLWGWSLTRSQDLEIPRTESLLEDIFFFSIVTACSISVAQMSVPPGYQARLLVSCITALVLSTLFVLPVTLITFRLHTWWQRLLSYSLLVALACLTIACLAWLSRQSALVWLADLWLMLVGIVTIALIGVASLLVSGFRLTRYAPKSSPAPDNLNSADQATSPFDNEEVEEATRDKTARRQARRLTAAVAVITVVLVAGNYVREQMILANYRQLVDPAQYLGAAVDRIDLEGDSIVGVTMRGDATLEDIRRVANKLPKLKRLSVAGVKITDDDLSIFDQFQKLEELDLSKTQITGKQLLKLRPVNKLSMADTGIPYLEAIVHADQKGVSVLDLSGNNITDQDLVRTSGIKMDKFMTSLKLARNPISDEGVTAIFASGIKPMGLDLSDTQVVGDCLLHPSSPARVNLDGTQVTDSVLVKLLKPTASNCNDLSLCRTQVTSNVLRLFDGRSLSLGHGAITEDDLLAMQPISFQHLGLHGPEFTGHSLLVGKIKALGIDLSGSAVTDDVLSKLSAMGWLQYIKLGHTRATAAGLQGVTAAEIDLRGLDITGAQIKKAGQTVGRVIIRHENCTPEDMLHLRGTQVSIDGESYWRLEYP